MVKKRRYRAVWQPKVRRAGCLFYSLFLLVAFLAGQGLLQPVYADNLDYSYFPYFDFPPCVTSFFQPRYYLPIEVKLPNENVLSNLFSFAFVRQGAFFVAAYDRSYAYTLRYDWLKLQSMVDRYQNPFSRYNPDNFFRKYALDEQRRDMQREFDNAQEYLRRLLLAVPVKTALPLKLCPINKKGKSWGETAPTPTAPLLRWKDGQLTSPSSCHPPL